MAGATLLFLWKLRRSGPSDFNNQIQESAEEPGKGESIDNSWMDEPSQIAIDCEPVSAVPCSSSPEVWFSVPDHKLGTSCMDNTPSSRMRTATESTAATCSYQLELTTESSSQTIAEEPPGQEHSFITGDPKSASSCLEQVESFVVPSDRSASLRSRPTNQQSIPELSCIEFESNLSSPTPDNGPLQSSVFAGLPQEAAAIEIASEAEFAVYFQSLLPVPDGMDQDGLSLASDFLPPFPNGEHPNVFLDL